MKVIGAIDQGTQSTRFILYDLQLNIVESSQVVLESKTPQAGWVEQDADELWSTVKRAMEETLAKARAAHPALEMLGIGITNQRETTVLWDTETGTPLAPAIVWSDSRTSGVCRAVQEAAGGDRDVFRPITGLPISPYFSAYKLRWLLDNVPSVRVAAASGRAAFGTVDSWLLYRLTGGAERKGVHVTDVTNACRTSLMDIATLEWDQSLIAKFGLEQLRFPRILSSAEIYGHVAGGPAKGVAIAGCLGDQQAATLGQLCRKHEAKNTYGTGCFMLLVTGEEPVPSTHGLLTTVAYRLGPQAPCVYALEGAVAVAGQGLSWLRDNLGLFADVADCEALAATVPNAGGVYFVPAFGGLLAPWWRGDARGLLAGLSQHSTKAHIVRATLEAMCFQTRDVLDAMRADADCSELGCLSVDGGAARNNLMLQLQADILQTPVRRPSNLETTSAGAAIAAGVGLGLWTPEQAFEQLRSDQGTVLFEPRISAEDAATRHRSWKMVVERSFGLDALSQF
ncbi:FGGY carbohydrate kinase [Helicosporidium sp. ATCC 50920]|nr:FGGY carbohydrate kinase [Helicosporidium sp. ATCC 50920]|eukprot:KDD76694.1 FGGY carbohydrate kinase [Helicosporidium sp. ATCC 50920]